MKSSNRSNRISNYSNTVEPILNDPAQNYQSRFKSGMANYQTNVMRHASGNLVAESE